jgi:hypothetical protein
VAAQALECSHLTFKDYMEGERDVEIRSEYVDGEIYSRAGASETTLLLRLLGLLSTTL